MRLCPYGSDTNATMPRTFDSSYHNVEVADVLHCLSPGTCSGDEALLSSGESGGGGGCNPLQVPRTLPVADSGLYTGEFRGATMTRQR